MTEEQQRKIFAKNLSYYIDLNQKQKKELAKDMGVASSTVSMWVSGKNMPPVSMIQKLADYFRIGKSDLVDNKLDSDPISDARILNNVEVMDMIQKFLKLPLDDRKAIEHLIESLSKKVES